MAKKIILISSIVFLLNLLLLKFYMSNSLIFNENIINYKDYDKIISTRKEYKDFVDLKHNNKSIPYDEVNNYYLLSQVENTTYKGFISIDDFEISILKTDKKKDEIVNNNENLVILAYNRDYYKIINLKLTYFPIIKLDNDLNKVIIFDNDKRRGVLSNQTYNMSYHIRGSSTAISDKPSYKLNILNSKGNKKKVSLLNMREDDDWILNSMTNDVAYMLEKIAYNIWGNMSEYNIELKYVELFIDNEYKGIYYLQEPADFKTYNANDKSLLVSTKTWKENITTPSLYNNDLIYNTVIDEFELDSKIKPEEQIELLRKYVSDVKNIKYTSDINIKYDMESIGKYSLFINLISAVDNTYKNQKILFRYINGKYLVELYPWDLDWSQNNELFSKRFNFLSIINNTNIPNIYIENKIYNKYIYETYKSLRKTIYNENYLFKIIENNKNLLVKSGAILREENKWGNRDLNKSVKNLKDFYSKKIKLLDQYYGGI